jgi:thiosulfate/3-mercaptopyruvate sulfurtransferase
MSADPVIEPASLLDNGEFYLLDVRGQDEFTMAHAPNAVRVPIEIWEVAAKADDTSLDNINYWEAAIDALGIGNDTLTVVYDDGRMTEAARVWFVLQHFGAKAAILNGGWPAIGGIKIPPVAKSAIPHRGRFRACAGVGDVGLIDRESLRAQLGPDIQILDARSRAEFTGEDFRRNARGGHLPGARHLSHARLLTGGLLRPAGELRHLLTEAGFAPGDHIITHCDGGGRAALAAAAAVRAGYSDVRAYYLSFADWARDESCSIVSKVGSS